jgi:hypothetical protein
MSIKNQLISGRVPVTTAANVAADRYQYLDLSSAEPNLGTGNTGDVLTYNSSFPGGRKWVAQAEIRGSIGEAAYSEANTASANTLYLSGVDLAQNNRLTAVETYAAAAYNKANTGGTFTGSVTINQDLSVSGNVTFSGNVISHSVDDLIIDDPLIYLANNNAGNLVDIGIIGNFTSGSYQHTGIVRDATSNQWKLFSNVVAEPTTTVDFSNAIWDDLQLGTLTGNVIAQTVVVNGIDFTQSQATQNTRLTIIEGVDTTQNTRMSVIEGVDVGQNTRMSIIEGVDVTQNTRLTIIEGVDATQNANITVIQGVDVWQNTQITSINSLAQAAFNKANTGARATASNTAPTGNTVGDLWLSLTDETLYMYSYDGVSNNWIDISGPILISSNILVQYTITANVS